VFRRKVVDVEDVKMAVFRKKAVDVKNVKWLCLGRRRCKKGGCV
jgi:hypothetical protein